MLWSGNWCIRRCRWFLVDGTSKVSCQGQWRCSLSKSPKQMLRELLENMSFPGVGHFKHSKGPLLTTTICILYYYKSRSSVDWMVQNLDTSKYSQHEDLFLGSANAIGCSPSARHAKGACSSTDVQQVKHREANGPTLFDTWEITSSVASTFTKNYNATKHHRNP